MLQDQILLVLCLEEALSIRYRVTKKGYPKKVLFFLEFEFLDTSEGYFRMPRHPGKTYISLLKSTGW